MSLGDLTPYEDGNWVFSSEADLGYYVHYNRVYLVGEITNEAAGEFVTVTTAILTGLPSEIRPMVDTDLTLTAILSATPDTATVGAFPDLTFPATITTAGDLALNALPFKINDAPNGSLQNIGASWPGGDPVLAPDFPNPLLYTIGLGNVSWAIGDPEVDDPPWTSMAAAVAAGGDFTDIDSQVAVHGTRIHVRGRVRANIASAATVATGLDASYTSGVSIQDTANLTATANCASPALTIVPDGLLTVDSDALSPTSSDGFAPMPGPTAAWRDATADPHQLVVIGDALGGTPETPSAVAGVVVHGIDGLNSYGRLTAPFVGDASSSFTSQVTANVTYDVSEQLGPYFPTPDWVAFQVSANLEHSGSISGLVFSATGWAGGDSVLFDGTSGDLNGGTIWLQRLDAGMLYTKDPYNLGASLMWRPDEIGSIALRADWAGSVSGTLGLTVAIVALYETRYDVILPGDIITLDGAGWPSSDPPTVIPAPAITTGVSTTGIVPLGFRD